MENIFTIPFKEPVLVFALVLLIILLSPLLVKKFRIPGIIGLIISGAIIGPYGFNLLTRDASVELFATVGLLYIMFVAGLEIDIDDFAKNKHRSLVFGVLTFTIPMTLGTLAGFYLLNLNLKASILLASMFASHTLLAYPIASKFGVSKNEAVTITVGGTAITDVAALLILAVIAGIEKGELNSAFWIRLGLSSIIFVALVLLALPFTGRWFFKNAEAEGETQFIFVLTGVFISAFLAKASGIEAIIGAFFAGLALNKLIPHSSPLMNRIAFVGNALFIPFFLISVGMLVDVRVFFTGMNASYISIVMTVIAIAAKWLAASSTQKIFKYSKAERNMIFGLSNAQAAATLAAVIVAYNLKIFDINILNGTIVMILITCLISSFAVEKAAREIATIEGEKVIPLEKISNRILVPISHPSTIKSIIDLALLLKENKFADPIYTLSVVRNDDNFHEEILRKEKTLIEAQEHASAAENEVQIISRIDTNIAEGIARAVKELLITEIIIGWNAKYKRSGTILGSILDHLLEKTNKMIIVYKAATPINTIRRIIVTVPKLGEYEKGFGRWINSIRKLSKESGAAVHFYGEAHTLNLIRDCVDDSKPVVNAFYNTINQLSEFEKDSLTSDDLFVLVSARPHTISWTRALNSFPKLFAKKFPNVNLIVLYPEQL